MNTDQKITKIEGFALSSEYGDGKVFGQPKGKKSIGFIEVTSESGIKGFGEAYCGIYSPELMNPIVKFLSKYIVGKSLKELSFFDDIDMIPFIGYTGIIQGVRVGIELAVMDLIGKIEEKPVYRLFNTEDVKQKIQCYYSGGSVVFSPDLIKKDIEDLLKMGFGAYKMRVGYQTWEKDITRIDTASRLLQNNRLMVDAIMGTLKDKWTLEEALQKTKEMESYGLYWLEEPLPRYAFDDLAKLNNSTPLRISGGENNRNVNEFKIMLEKNSYDVLQPECMVLDGMTDMLKIAKLATFYDKTVIPHHGGWDLGQIAHLHFVAAFEHSPFLELLNDPPIAHYSHHFATFENAPVVKDGWMDVPEGPGLGIEINPDYLP